MDRLRLKLLKSHKPGTVRNVLELLRRLVNFAAKKHLCPVPTFTIEMPKVNNLKTEDLTLEQLTALLEAVNRTPTSRRPTSCAWPCSPACGAANCSG